MLTLSEGKGSASFDAGPLYVDGGCRGEGCSARDGGDVQPNMAATKQTGQGGSGRDCAARDGGGQYCSEAAPLVTKGDNPAARLLRLGRRGVLPKINAGCASCRFR